MNSIMCRQLGDRDDQAIMRQFATGTPLGSADVVEHGPARDLRETHFVSTLLGRAVGLGLRCRW